MHYNFQNLTSFHKKLTEILSSINFEAFYQNFEVVSINLLIFFLQIFKISFLGITNFCHNFTSINFY